MTPPPRVLRRWVVVPLAVVLSPVLAAVLLVVALAGVLSWPWDRRCRLLRIAGFALAYVWVDLYLVGGCTARWLRRPRRRTAAAHAAWTTAHAALLQRALQQLLTAAGRTVGFRVALEPGSAGPPRDPDPVLFLARHGGPGDSFTMVWLVLTVWDRVPRIVLTDRLQWDPGLDLVLTRLGACFLPTGQGSDTATRIAETAATLTAGQGLLLFPEGGNWTPARHRRAIARLRRSGANRAARQAAATPRVLPPRPSGTAAALEARPDLGVVVLAHTGLDQLTTPSSVWQAVPFRAPLRVRCWRQSTDILDRVPEEIPDWLNGVWAEVDGWIRTRPPPAATDNPEPELTN